MAGQNPVPKNWTLINQWYYDECASHGYKKSRVGYIRFVTLLGIIALSLVHGVESRAHLLSSALNVGIGIISQPLFEAHLPLASGMWQASVDCVCLSGVSYGLAYGTTDYCPCFAGVSYEVPRSTNMCNTTLDIIYSNQFEFDNTIVVGAANILPSAMFWDTFGGTGTSTRGGLKSGTFHNSVQFEVRQGSRPYIWCCYGVISGSSGQCQLSASPLQLPDSEVQSGWYDYLFGPKVLSNKEMHALNGNIKHKQKTIVKREVKAIKRALKPRVKGRGDYAEDAGEWLGKKTGNYLGSELGNASRGESWGGKAGRWLGAKARDIFKGIFGLGDYHMPSYKTQKNSLLNGGNDPPIVSNVSREIVVTHREFIQNIVGTTTFTNQSFPINPGLPTMPWLESLAANFEEYEMVGMLFEYKSLYSDASTTPYLGAVIMATEYNSAKPAFADKLAMENSEFASSAKPSVSMFHPIECAMKETPTRVKYIRTGPVPSGSAINLYDVGLFQIATEGQPSVGAGGVIGELWCTYNIRLLKPILTTAIGSQVGSDVFYGVTGANGVLTSLTANTGNNIGITYSQATISANAYNETFTFPSKVESGVYQMIITYYGTGATIVTPAVGGAHLDYGTLYYNQTGPRTASQFVSPVDGVASISWTFQVLLELEPGTANSVFYYQTGSATPCVLPTAGRVMVQFVQMNPSAIVGLSGADKLMEKVIAQDNQIAVLREAVNKLMELNMTNENLWSYKNQEIDSPVIIKSTATATNSPELSASTVLAGKTYLQSLLRSV